VLVPELTRTLRDNDPRAMIEAGSRGLELAVGLALPATLGLIVLREPIVRALFQHGAFTELDTAATAQTLMWLSLALPAYVLVKALSPAFFAREDTRTPLLATLAGFAVTIAAALLLGRTSGTEGIAAAMALGAWACALVLVRHATRTFGIAIDSAARRRLPRIVVAALSMGALLWPEARFVLPWTAEAHGVAQFAVVGIVIAGAGATYGLLLVALGGIDARDLAGRIGVKAARDLRDKGAHGN
jgi:putative peptidoglycan lipid II flippase